MLPKQKFNTGRQDGLFCLICSSKMTEVVLLLFILVIFCSCLTDNGFLRLAFRPVIAEAAGTDSSEMDVVIVIDTSGSMNYTDPDHMAAEAALLFLNMLEERGSRAAIVSFSDEVQVLRPLQELRMDEEGEALRSLLETLPGKGDTDLGAAAKMAVDLLKTEKTSREEGSVNQAILFFTDGCIDLPDETREETSRVQFSEAVGAAASRDCRIYTIGLDHPDNESEYHLDETILKEAAERSGGSYRYVREASQLPEVFHLVFSDFIESRSRRIGDLTGTGEQQSSMQITIPDNSVLEADIILIPADQSGPFYGSDPDSVQNPASSGFGAASDGDSEDEAGTGTGEIMLSDPSGSQADLMKSGTIRLIRTKAYTLIKLIAPECGIWNLSVSDEKDYHVHVNLLLQYQIDFVSKMEEVDETAQKRSDTVKVRAYFERDGRKIEDPKLYEQFSCTAQIYRENSPLAWGYPEEEPAVLSFSEEAGCWEETIEVYPGSSVSVLAHAEGDTLSRDGGMLHFTSSGSDAIIVHRLPESICLAGFFPEDAVLELDLGSCFEAWDGSACMISVSEGMAESFGSDMLPKAGSFLLRGIHSGSGTLAFDVRDRYGNQIPFSIPVTVMIRWEKIRIILLICAGVIAAGLIIWLLSFRNKKQHGSPGGACLQKLVFRLDGFSSEEGTLVCFMDKDAERLDRLWTKGRTANADEKERFEQIILKAGSSLSQIRVGRKLFRRQGGGLIIASAGRDSILVNCYGNHCRRMLLQDQDAFEIHLLQVSGENGKSGKIILYGEFEEGPFL